MLKHNKYIIIALFFIACSKDDSLKNNDRCNNSTEEYFKNTHMSMDSLKLTDKFNDSLQSNQELIKEKIVEVAKKEAIKLGIVFEERDIIFDINNKKWQW